MSYLACSTSRKVKAPDYALICEMFFDWVCSAAEQILVIVQVVFTPDGKRLISAGADGLLCVYDTSHGYHPIRAMACDVPEPSRTISLSVSVACIYCPWGRAGRSLLKSAGFDDAQRP